MREPGDEVQDEGANDSYLPYACAYCGEPNEVFVDPSAGTKQQLVEDCAVCCRPNVLKIHFDGTGSATIEVEFEG